MPDTSILIVDDHELIREGLGAILNGVDDLHLAGYAGSGAEALKVTRQVRPDVAVVDLGLPDMNGLQLIRELSRRYPATEVVVLSIYADEAYVGEAFLAGAKGYVVKDAPAEELIKGVRAVRRGERYLSSTLDQTQLDNYQQGKPAPRGSLSLLTAREMQVLAHIADGLNSQQISERLEIRRRTVDTHRASIKRKLRLRTTADLITYAVRIKLLTQGPRLPE